MPEGALNPEGLWEKLKKAEKPVVLYGTGNAAEKIMNELGIPQPNGEAVTDIEAGVRVAERIGYPVLVRPSYVLGGRAMQIVPDEDALRHYLRTAVLVSEDQPVLVDHYITGKELEKKLDEVYITANKNAIPNDPQSPFVTSGVRLGTPAVTTRGMVPADMDIIAECIHLTATDFDGSKEKVRAMVEELCAKYPLYE